MRDRDLAVLLRRDASGDVALRERLAEPVGVIALVIEQGFGARQGVEQHGSTSVVAHLPLTEQHDQRPALTVVYGMKFRI